MRTVGTVSRGVRCPVIREGDDLVQIVTQSILECAEEQGIAFQDRDIVAVTEAVVARAQGNYATTDEIAQDCREKFGADEIAITFPDHEPESHCHLPEGDRQGLSKKVYILMSYPSDEVGNHLFEEDLLDEKGVNPWSDVLDEKQYRDLFGYEKHPFTGVDYVGVFWRPLPFRGLRAGFYFSATTCAPCCGTQKMYSAATFTPVSAPAAGCWLPARKRSCCSAT